MLFAEFLQRTLNIINTEKQQEESLVTTRKKSAKMGNFVQIPLKGGSFGYAKVLVEPEIGFLDLRTFTPDVSSEELEAASPLFRLWVMAYALKPKSNWCVAGHQDARRKKKN